MKKQLVVIGIVAMLVCVGLSGCQNTGKNIVSIGELNANPEKYINKTVTVRGFIVVNIIEDTSNLNSIIFKYSDNFSEMNKVNSGEFYFTGIFKYGDFQFYGKVCYLVVTDIDSI